MAGFDVKRGGARALAVALLGWTLAAAMAAAAKEATPEPAAASAPEDSPSVLRQRLAERLAQKGDSAPVKVATHGGKPEHAGRDTGKKSEAKKADAKEAAAAHRDLHWSYEGVTGPEHWAELNPEFRQCASGQRQSPIDVRDTIKVDLEPIQIDYHPTAFSVVDNGHTVQVNLKPGNAIQVMGRRYELLEFHFHRPSEERINGRQFDMEAHLVHKDAEGHLAVIAVELERGHDQPVVQTVWNNLPLEKNEELAAQVLLDPALLLPQDKSYFTYMGSLTTPPCSEGVLWMVMRQPVEASAQELAIFGKLYPMNARPLQGLSARLIKESN